MKPRIVLGLLITAALSAIAGWFAARHFGQATPTLAASASAASGRKILYYQSSMHPWVKSDKPGKCTVCGMDLTPVFEGGKAINPADGLVNLGKSAIQVLNVQTVPVAKHPLVRTLRVAGTIEDNGQRHRMLTAWTDGRIEKLNINFVGAEVEAGQPLATLYSPMLLATEREYTILFRQSQMSHGSQLINEHRRLLAATEQRLLRLGLTHAQIGRLPFKSETNQLSEILAPVAGTVVKREVYEGQYVKEGDKLFELADFFTMWFQFDLYERDLAWVRVGQLVEVSVPSVPGKSFSAPITFIDPTLNDMTRSARVRVELQNPVFVIQGRPRRELLHKTYAEAVVKLDTPEVLALPRQAVLNTGDRAVVYVDRGESTYEQRKVRLGRAGDDHWEILDGLAAGDRVVTTGNLLIDGQAQLNSQAAGGDPAPAPVPAVTTLNDAQIKALRDLFAGTESLTEALAADKLVDFQQHALKLHPLLPTVTVALADTSLAALAKTAEIAGHELTGTDLKSARKKFTPFSHAVVEITKAVRKLPEFSSWRVLVCPMTAEAFPGAPAKGFWLQSQAKVRNPFYGAEMIDCGQEVKP